MIWNGDYNYLYATLVGMIFTLNGIALPLSYNMIADKYKEYLDKNVHEYFIKESAFRENIIISFICLSLFILPLFFNDKVTTEESVRYFPISFCNGYLIVTGIMFIWFLITFFSFSRTIYYYVTKTDEIVFNQIKIENNEYLSN